MIPVRHIGDLNVGHELHVEISEALADASRTISRDAGLDVITEDQYVSRTAIYGNNGGILMLTNRLMMVLRWTIVKPDPHCER